MELRKGYKQTEVSVIPEDWEVAPLKSFTPFISYGFIIPMPTSENGIYMITAKDITNGQIQFDTARRTTIDAYKTRLTAKSRPKKNDVLLTKDGTLGRLALVDETPICINQSVAVLRPNTKIVPLFLKILLEAPVYHNRMVEDAGGTTIKHIYITTVSRMLVGVPPTKAEQEAIAEALTDADALIESLTQLTAKKRQIKQGAMQELLTGKRRLHGFSGKWETKLLGDVCEITTGKKDVNEGNPNGEFPFFTCSRSYTFSNSYSFDTEAILIAGNGDVGNLHYYRGKFEAYQRTYVLSVFSANISYLWQQLSAYLADSLGLGKIGSSIPYIKKENLINFEFESPLDEAEQEAIAEVLSEMDDELATLEAKLAKARALKQGMMHELLTGRIRLV